MDGMLGEWTGKALERKIEKPLIALITLILKKPRPYIRTSCDRAV